MLREELISPAAVAPVRPAVTHAPHWRAVLEARWRARLYEVTRLSLAYHGAAAAAPDGRGAAGQREVERLLRSAVAARRKLADTEEALARLAAGSFGRCEQCVAVIPAGLLSVLPETRYCPRCDAPAIPWPTAAARPEGEPPGPPGQPAGQLGGRPEQVPVVCHPDAQYQASQHHEAADGEQEPGDNRGQLHRLTSPARTRLPQSATTAG